MNRVLIVALYLLLILATSISARVWYVKPDGTGDAPHIQAGIDSCSHGDTVLAAAGQFEGEGNHDIDFRGKAIVVRSEYGVQSAAICCSDGVSFYFRSGEDSMSVLEGFSIGEVSFVRESVAPEAIADLDISDIADIVCVSSSPTIKGNALRSDIYPAFILRGSSARILNNYIYVGWWLGGIRSSAADSSIIMDNSFCAGDEYSWFIRCDHSFNKIIGNEFEGGCEIISCWDGSYEILDNQIGNTGSSFIAGSCAICCDASTATIRGNAIQYAGLTGIVVGNGSYWIENNRIRYSIYFGENYGGGIACYGVDSTTAIASNLIVHSSDNHDEGYGGKGGGIYCDHASPLINKNVIADNEAEEGGAISCVFSSPQIVGNTIVGNAGMGAIHCANQSSPIITQNIIANNVSYIEDPAAGIWVADTSSHPVIACNDFFNNEGGNYAGIPDQTGMNGNISVDPLFCDLENEDYQLHGLSSCLPGNHPDGAECGLIGALGKGCGEDIATLLQDYQAEVEGSDITIKWRLSEAGAQMDFLVLRAEFPGAEYSEIPGASIMKDGMSFEFRDRGCSVGSAYRYRVDVVDEAGRRPLFETEVVSLAPLRLALYQNYPNPFNPSTRISYSLPGKEWVRLEIYDISGKRVVQLVDGEQERGSRAAEWNGTNARGDQVTSGVYFCRLTVDKKAISRKLILLR